MQTYSSVIRKPYKIFKRANLQLEPKSDLASLQVIWSIYKNEFHFCNSNIFLVQSLSCVRLFADPMDCSMPGFSVLHYLPEFVQVRVHWVGDAIWPLILCHPLLLLPQSFPASGSFPISWLFILGGQSIGVSVSVRPMNIQVWFPLGLTGLISLLSKGLSRVFYSTTTRKHQFFSTQPSLWSNSHINTQIQSKLWVELHHIGPFLTGLFLLA